MRCSRPRSGSSTTTRSCRGTRRRSRGSRRTRASCFEAVGGRTPTRSARRPAEVAARILRDLSAARAGSSCSTTRRTTATRTSLDPEEKAEKEDKERNREARVWFRGLEELQRAAPLKAVYDLSATPYYLKGSRLQRGLHLPVGRLATSRSWMRSSRGSSRSRASRSTTTPSGRAARLPQPLGQHPAAAAQADQAQRAQRRTTGRSPKTLEGALQSLYRSYVAGATRATSSELAELGEPPPVMIVVCPNTAVSKLVFDWVAGWEKELERRRGRARPGRARAALERRGRRLGAAADGRS